MASVVSRIFGLSDFRRILNIDELLPERIFDALHTMQQSNRVVCHAGIDAIKHTDEVIAMKYRSWYYNQLIQKASSFASILSRLWRQ